MVAGDDLVAYAEACNARRDHGRLVGQSVVAGGDAEAMCTGLGYHTVWTSWLLELPAGTDIVDVHLPTGYVVRTYVPDADDQAVYRVIEDAFNEWPDRDPPTFEAWQLRLVEDDDLEALGHRGLNRTRAQTHR